MQTADSGACIPVLDNAALHCILSWVDHPITLGRCLAVSKRLRDVAAQPALWRSQLFKLEHEGLVHRLSLNALSANLPLYIGWRYNWWNSGAARLVIETGQYGQRDRLCIVEPSTRKSVPLPCMAVSDERPTTADVQQPTWSPNGRFLAYTVVERRRTPASGLGVGVQDYLMLMSPTGGLVLQVALDGGYPPFYYCWSPCSNYLAMLSNWPGRRVGLRVLDVANALRPRRCGTFPAAPRVAYLGSAVPLYFCWCPTEPKILIHASSRVFSLWDVNQGFFQDCELDSAGNERCWKAPPPLSSDVCQWQPIHTSPQSHGTSAPKWWALPQGGTRFLLPVVEQSPAPRAPGHPPAAPTAALETRHRMVMVDPERDLGDVTQAPTLFATEAELVMAAINVGAGLVAWVAGRKLLVGPLDQHQAAYHTPLQIYPPPDVKMDASTSTGGPDPGRASLMGMQWSPDGRRLLFLTSHHCLMPGAPFPMCYFRWHVFECGNTAAGRSHRLLSGCRHLLSAQMLRHYVPFMDQYILSLSFWSPDSSSVCFAASFTNPDDRTMSLPLTDGDTSHVYLQPVEAQGHVPQRRSSSRSLSCGGPSAMEVDMVAGPVPGAGPLGAFGGTISANAFGWPQDGHSPPGSVISSPATSCDSLGEVRCVMLGDGSNMELLHLVAPQQYSSGTFVAWTPAWRPATGTLRGSTA